MTFPVLLSLLLRALLLPLSPRGLLSPLLLPRCLLMRRYPLFLQGLLTVESRPLLLLLGRDRVAAQHCKNAQILVPSATFARAQATAACALAPGETEKDMEGRGPSKWARWRAKACRGGNFDMVGLVATRAALSNRRRIGNIQIGIWWRTCALTRRR